MTQVGRAEALLLSGDFQGAVQCIDSLFIACPPPVPTPKHGAVPLCKSEAAQAFSVKAEALLSLHEFENTVVACNMGLMNDASCTRLLRTKAKALLAANVTDKALEAAETAVMLSPSDPDDFLCRYFFCINFARSLIEKQS